MTFTISIEQETLKQIVSVLINFGVGFTIWLVVAICMEELKSKWQYALLFILGALVVSATAWVTVGGSLNIIAGIAGSVTFFGFSGELSEWYYWCKARVIPLVLRLRGENRS